MSSKLKQLSKIEKLIEEHDIDIDVVKTCKDVYDATDNYSQELIDKSAMRIKERVKENPRRQFSDDGAIELLVKLGLWLADNPKAVKHG